VEHPVPEHVRLGRLQGIRRQPRRDHLVPLQDLEQDDPVQKTTEAHPEKGGGRDHRTRALLRWHAGRGSGFI
jgi:hypothetical protein